MRTTIVICDYDCDGDQVKIFYSGVGVAGQHSEIVVYSFNPSAPLLFSRSQGRVFSTVAKTTFTVCCYFCTKKRVITCFYSRGRDRDLSVAHGVSLAVFVFRAGTHFEMGVGVAGGYHCGNFTYNHL